MKRVPKPKMTNGTAVKRQSAETPENANFDIEEKLVNNPGGLNFRQTDVIVLTDVGCRVTRNLLELYGLVPPCHIPIGYFLKHISRFSDYDRDEYVELKQLIEPEFARQKEIVDELYAQGRARYDLLWILFAEDTLISWTGTHGNRECGIILSSVYVDGFDAGFKLRISRLTSDGTDLFLSQAHLSIAKFNDLALGDISGHPKIITENDEEFATLVARGQKWVSMATDVFVMDYDGFMAKPGFFGNISVSVKGRCVVDVRGSSYFSNVNYNENFEHESKTKVDPRDDKRLLATAPSTLPAYAIGLHDWGLFNIDGLSPTVYNRAAFDKLVLDDELKDTVRALVSGCTAVDIPDIIAGKGGGVVLLLYGKPGTGKTLTAEVVAEHLGKPLLFVRAASISNTRFSDDVGKYFALAKRWNGVVLIDEADVLLMQRGPTDIKRNAVVANMLVELERHEGIVFLTTNRISDFDAAVASRITYALKFDPLDEFDRRDVWAVQIQKAMESARLPDETPMLDLDEKTAREWAETLSGYDINGRIIRTVFKNACSIAWHRKEKITLSDLHGIIRQQLRFHNDVAKSDSPL
jgi:AAA+ superfamily predicted ATPase